MPNKSFISGVEDTVKSLQQEAAFQKAYAKYAKKTGMSPNPDDKEHYYDYRSAYKAGSLNPDKDNHLPSKFKREGHSRLYMSADKKTFSATPKKGYVDTRNNKVQP